MPKYTDFQIELDPSNLFNLSTELHSKESSAKDFSSQIQLESFAETVNLVTQTSLYKDPNFREKVISQAESKKNLNEESLTSIYSKAKAYDQNQQQNIEESYRSISIADTDRLSKLHLVKDGVEVVIEDLGSKVANHHPKRDPSEKITMDMVVNYLQDQHNVSISEEQRNFLRSQWNQSGPLGSASSITDTGFFQDGQIIAMVEPDPAKKRVDYFHFEKGKLTYVEVKSSIVEITDSQPKKATSAVKADLSNLVSSEKSQSIIEPDKNDYLPKFNPNKITISYFSKDGIGCEISEDIVKSIKEHALFKSQTTNSFLSKFTKMVKGVQKFISNLRNNIKGFISYFSSKSTTNESNISSIELEKTNKKHSVTIEQPSVHQAHQIERKPVSKSSIQKFSAKIGYPRPTPSKGNSSTQSIRH